MIVKMKLAAVATAALIFISGCGKSDQSAPAVAGSSTAPTPPRKIVIGLVAKSQDNPVFQAAWVGAKDAATELSAKYNVDIQIDWQTPAKEDAQKQADAIKALAGSGAAGIAISCSDAKAVTPSIDTAVDQGVAVMCFDSDASASKRFCYYGTDDATCGRHVMEDLSQVMGGKGAIAILAGNPTAPNLQARVQGVRDVIAEKYPDIKIVDVVHHVEEPGAALEAVKTEQSTHPEITGWAMVGGWPLFTKSPLPWEAGTVKVVSVDALPMQLGYLKDHSVQELLAQDCYGWGHRSVEILIDKILNQKTPDNVRVIDPLTKVTADNADDFGKNWDKWLKQ